MKSLIIAVLLCAGLSAQTPAVASNSNTMFFAFLVHGNPAATQIDPDINSGYGILVTVCDARPEVVGFVVHVTGTGSGLTLDRSKLFGEPKNAANCMTTWFQKVGPLQQFNVTADPVFLQCGQSLTSAPPAR